MGDRLPPPPHLTDAARDIWRDHVHRLRDNDHWEAFALMCQTLGLLRGMDRILEAEGLTVISDAGALKAHPILAARKSAADTFLRVAEKFDLLPEQVKQSAAEPEAKNEGPANPFPENDGLA